MTTCTRLLRRADVVERTGLSAATIDRREREGTFPRRVRLGPAQWSPIAWAESEIADWIEARLAEREADTGPAGA